MTSRSFALAVPRTRPPLAPYVTAAAVLGLSLLTARLLLEPARVRLVIAAAVAIALLGLATRSPRVLLAATVVWLASLGMVRRLVTEIGTPTRLDPLLLVGPLALGVLVLFALRTDALSPRTRLSKAVLALSVLILVGAVNPLGGSLFAGLAGLLFVFVPTLGFWIGRATDDRTMGQVVRLIAVVGVGVALYALAQTLVGFPSWDRLWISQVDFASLNVNGVIRPFATFASAQELGLYLDVTAVILIVAASRMRYAPVAVPALAVVIPALVLESSRSVVVTCIVALGLMLGARMRMPLVFAAVVGALLLVGLVVGLRSYGPATTNPSATSALVSHDVSGLSNPLNPQTSTAGAHLSLLVHGLESAFKNPAGYGIARVTIAGSTFGGVTASTEIDPSNVAVALGLPGLIAYLVVLLTGIRLVYTMARRRGDLLSLVGLGIVVVTMFQWLNGGLYSVAFLPWLVLGWSERRASDAE